MHSVPVLPIGRYRAVFSCEDTPRFSDFPANAWRGALGYALKRSVCVTRQPECSECMLYRSCLYPYFWDTPPHVGAEKMRKYTNAPHPFVLEPDPAEPWRLGFTLLGQANRHLPVFIHALTQAAAGPHGISGNVLELSVVEQESTPGADDWQVIFRPGEALKVLPTPAPLIPPAPVALDLEIVSSLRVKREGRYVGPDDFVFADLFGNLLRRISMLTYFHTDTPLATDFWGLNEVARLLPARTSLRWWEQTRYSKRQQASMQMGGVVGHLILERLDQFLFWPNLWPYIWLGQYTHAGSGATMGMGWYRIVASLREYQVITNEGGCAA